MRKIIRLTVAALLFAGSIRAATGIAETLSIQLPPNAQGVARHGRDLMVKKITQRSNACIVGHDMAELHIELAIDGKLKAEAFRIADGSNNGVRITGGDEQGLIYGIGKFLHNSRFGPHGFTPGTWRGTSAPQAQVRGIYMASHFNNYYEAAPIEEIQEYIDEMALWGLNYVQVTFPRWQFESLDDPKAQHSISRLIRILGAAKAVGMKTSLLMVANDGFLSTPQEYWRTPIPDPGNGRGNQRMNLCPNIPGALEMLLSTWSDVLDQFASVKLDTVELWPYDEGGCGCEVCWPWGAHGFPKLCRSMAHIAQDKIPGVKVIISTWKFDLPDYGEFVGLAKALEEDPSWADYILSDSAWDFPRYPLDHGVPGGLPMLNFPEISMWGQEPWGGYGANPFPARLQKLWDQTEGSLSGGFPYSEGIYEDINLVICNQLYWDGSKSTIDIVHEYASYEFSPDVADDVVRAIKIMESNHHRKDIDSSANGAWRLIKQADAKLTPQARQAWRWRILYLRALIDRELCATKGELRGETLKQSFQELTDIYHAANSFKESIRPPVIP